MNRDTDLFVQAFWVKCRETIRPELDQMVDELNERRPPGARVDPGIFGRRGQAARSRPVAHPDRACLNGAPEASTLRFRGDVARRDVEVARSGEEARRYELAALDVSVAKREIADWVTDLLSLRP